MAVKLGFAFNKIIFNGPIKTYSEIKTAILNGSILNIDSEYEIEDISKIRKEFPNVDICVGLRINMEIDTDNGSSAIVGGLKESRFGMTENTLSLVIPRLQELDVKIISLHGHTSSTNRIAENYRIISRKLLEVQSKYNLNDIKYFNVGGAFFGAAPECLDVSSKPTYIDYAEAITSTFLENDWFKSNEPYIVIEPGASVVSNVFDLATKIYQKKTIKNMNMVFVDASIFMIKSIRSMVNYPTEIYSINSKESKIKANIVGSTCMEVDIISKDVELEHYSYGDYIIVRGVGAYRNNRLPFFINSRPPIVELMGEGKYQILRNRQTAEDMLISLNYIR